jgi:hypothetical protein
MKTVFAAYYKQIGGGKSFIKFFESRQDAEVYLTSDAYYGKLSDQFDLDYKFKKLEEDYEIVERSLVDVLNEIYAWGKDTEDRLNYHSL